MVNHLFKVESSNVVVPEVNYDLICISFPLVIRNNNVLIQHAYSGRWILRSQHSYAEGVHVGPGYNGPGCRLEADRKNTQMKKTRGKMLHFTQHTLCISYQQEQL